MNDLARLHRRLLIVLGLASLMAFVSGAGFESPLPALAGGSLLLALVWEPSVQIHERLEWMSRLVAVALALRAVHYILTVPEDVVMPLVDVLLVLLASEALRPAATTERTRMYLLSCALLVAAAAYRAGVGFGIAFVTYVSVGTVSLLIGHLLREAHRFGIRPAPLPRDFLMRVAKLSAVMLFMSGLLFVAFPRVSRNWVTRGTPTAGSVVGFSDRVSLAEHGGRIYPNPEVVLRVEFPTGERPAGRNLYWRGRSYDFFDGMGWWRSPRVRSANVPPRVYRERWPSQRSRQKIYAVPLDVAVLFALSPTLSVSPQSSMRWASDATGDLWYDGVGPPVYEALSVAHQPSDRVLSEFPGTLARADDAYLQLPELAPEVLALADSLVQPHATRIEQARSIEGWLRAQFRYTLDLPATAREATLENFLFRRRAGHCEYFSTAMVVLLRAAGIPARNVNGFLGGEWNQFGKFLTVTQNQAHSWVEAWFPGYGWVMFDPTPSTTTDSAAAQRPWFAPLRFLVDGLEHRWNKWVLEYSVDLQLGLFRRAADALTAPAVRPSGEKTHPLRRVTPFLVAALVLLAVVRLLTGRGRGGRISVGLETRLYLRLRRAYRHTGSVTEHDPPLAFLGKLKRAGAPGAELAEAVVGLYLDSRFGGIDIGESGRSRMREALDAALRSVRRSRRAA